MAETFEKPKGFKKKLENFWYHYKAAVLIVAFFVFSATYLAVDYLRKKEPDMVLAYVSETYGDQTQFLRVEEELKQVIGDVNGDGRKQLNYRLIVIREDFTSYDVDKTQHFNYSFLDKNARLFIIEDKFFEQKKDYFEPLKGIVPDELLEGGLKNDAGEVCAIPLLESAVAEKMDFARPELYVGIKRMIDTEKHEKLVPLQHEKSKEVIRYIMTGQG